MSNQLQVTGTAIFSAAGQSIKLTSASDVYLNVTRGASILNIGIDATGSFYNTSTSHRFFTNSGTINALTIASTGAATFSSSVTSPVVKLSDSTLSGAGNFEFTSEAFFGARFQSNAYKFMAGNNSTEYMRISSGNVLIGTTTDAGYKLDVSAISRIYNGDQGSARLVIQNTGSGGQAVNLIAGNPNVDQTGFSIAYGNTNFLRFDSSGAATFSSSVQAAGEITTGSIARAFLRQTAGGDAELGCKTGGITSVWSEGAAKLSFAVGGAATFSSLIGTGSRTVTADANGTLSASSDSSLKQEDITHQIEGLAEILQLKPRAYKWLSDIEIRGKEAVTEIGFFADEVNSIIPSAAPKGKDGLYGFYDRAIIASLVKGMQEQQAQIEELKALISNK